MPNSSNPRLLNKFKCLKKQLAKIMNRSLPNKPRRYLQQKESILKMLLTLLISHKIKILSFGKKLEKKRNKLNNAILPNFQNTPTRKGLKRLDLPPPQIIRTRDLHLISSLMPSTLKRRMERYVWRISSSGKLQARGNLVQL